jgi:hypothetical protein
MNNPMSQSREDYAATCCAIQNLWTKWTTGAVNFDERFAKDVGFDGGKEYIVGTLGRY